MTRAALTERLLRLCAADRILLTDLYQVRFADEQMVHALAQVAGAQADVLQSAGLLRGTRGSKGTVYWLSQTGERAARALLPDGAHAGGRAYAALRLEHELLRGRVYVALRQEGMRPDAYRAEPRLSYRSAAGLGERTLVPDGMVTGPRGHVLLEVDRGSEGQAALRHKWLRYREWLLDARGVYGLSVLALEPGRIAQSLEGAGLEAAVYGDPRDLAQGIVRYMGK